MKLTKNNFVAGSPFSCWLKEQMYGELTDLPAETRGLVKKYKIHVDDETIYKATNFRRLDEIPPILQKVAVDIIRAELDPNFKI